MYNLNQFCNIITELRKERGWTQINLAKKIGISPQSISKWECGIGYPDVTLFPILAELFNIPIGVLFGENQENEDKHMQDYNLNQKKFVFDSLSEIEIECGNICRIEIINDKRENSSLIATGDDTFIRYLYVEADTNSLHVYIKNPSGSDIKWIPYDRKNYKNDNKIKIFTGSNRHECGVVVINYLDLNLTQLVNSNGNTEWICYPDK